MDDTAGLDAALAALFWMAVALLVVTVGVAWALSRFGAGRRGVAGFLLALAVIVSVEIGSVVVWRAINHEMTVYDFVWLLASAGIGTACANRLFHHRTREYQA
jgi:hypothetical protein